MAFTGLFTYETEAQEADHRRAVLELAPDWDWSNGHWSGTDFDQLA